MKKAITILAVCSLLLSGCGQTDDAGSEPVNTTTTVAESTADADTTETSSAKEEKDTSEAATTALKTSSHTVSSVSKPTTTTVSNTEKKVSSIVPQQSKPAQSSRQTEKLKPEIKQTSESFVQTQQTIENKPQSNKPSTQVTTAKPAVTNPPTTTTPKPQTTVPQTEMPTAGSTEEERYIDIGRNLSHDGSDYGKAEAVYNWMIENGSGTCVNYSYKTYLICQGIGLDCYACWTDLGIYGHVANIVKVDGTWYVLDTQAGAFLDYNYGFTEVVDIDENHIANGSMISDYSYEELHE